MRVKLPKRNAYFYFGFAKKYPYPNTIVTEKVYKVPYSSKSDIITWFKAGKLYNKMFYKLYRNSVTIK